MYLAVGSGSKAVVLFNRITAIKFLFPCKYDYLYTKRPLTFNNTIPS